MSHRLKSREHNLLANINLSSDEIDRYLAMDISEYVTAIRDLPFEDSIALTQLAKIRKGNVTDRNYPRNEGGVYLIRSSIGLFKIGYTRNKNQRFSQIRQKLPDGITISEVHFIPSDEARDLESRLHKQYSHRRFCGEWFNLSEDDVKKIQELG